MPRSLRRPEPNYFAATLCVALAIWLTCAAQATLAQNQPLEDLAHFPQSTLTIKSGKNSHVFQIWTADTPARKAQGLMFVRGLAADRGMLFVNEAPRVASMWMKNTYIPLDMVFIDANGKIAEIHANTTPHSLEIVSSRKPVLAVLELAAGEAAKRGLKPGDRVLHPALGTAPSRGKKPTNAP
jgi:uncharacterized membrane protein (UPF0127 family)